jgi:hypothetical protein
MHLTVPISLLSLLSSFSLALTTPTPEAPQIKTTSHVQNANHIFNAIHSSMRQWGSSLNHNGMSFFLATVSAGTQLYHGGSDKEPVKGMEWLAFEPEHALIFARPRGGPGGIPPPGKGRPPPPGGPPGEGLGEGPHRWGERKHHKGDERGRKHHGEPEHGEERQLHPPSRNRPPFDGHHRGPLPKEHHDQPPFEHESPPVHGPPHSFNDDESLQSPLKHPHGPPPHHDDSDPEYSREHPHRDSQPDCDDNESSPPHRSGQNPIITDQVSEPAKTGFLHTYVPKHNLRLLYIDGMSAGKTSNGTLDTQDMLLLNFTSHGPMGGEYDRAQGLCNLSSTLWENNIDGVLRMEGGFEIILCEFEKHLERVDIMAVVGRGERGGMGCGYEKAITERYHGIGGGRVALDYSSFVTAFEYPGLDLWTNDVVSDTAMPRLQNVGEEDLEKIKGAVTAMILSNSTSSLEEKINWQAATDQLLGRYSTPLHHLFSNTPIRSSKEAYATYLSILLRPFIDHTSRNSSFEIARCIGQFIPPLPLPPSVAPSLAHKSIHAVAHHLCTTLLSASDIATLSLSRSLAERSPPPSGAVELVDSLKEYLQWTSWKWCQGGCEDTEICVVPIWPMGTHEEHKNPTCKGEGTERRGGYWGIGGFGRPPPPGERPPGEGRRGRNDGIDMRKGHGNGRKHSETCRRKGHEGIWAVIKRETRVVRGWFMGRV